MNHADRAIVMQAAAIGACVDVGILSAVAGSPAASVRAVLERAQDLQLVVSLGDDRYSFRHALTRDIIYAETLNGGARALHRRIVCVLERMRSLHHVALADLAHHAWKAGDARRVVRYNELAGDHAAAVHATDDARQYYARARSCTEEDSAEYLRVSEKLRVLR